jgi:dipeptidase E
MPLLLTSAGFENPHVGAVFTSLLAEPETARVALFMTAARTDIEKRYATACQTELQQAGIRDIRLREMDHAFTAREFDDLDAVYVSGGNTFYLLHKMRDCGFKTALVPFLKRGGVYVGVSAGSIVPGPEIATAGWGGGADANDVGLTDLTGLEVVDFSILPHFTPDQRAEINALRDRVDYDVLTLTDHQAVLVEGRTRTVMG